MYRVLANVKANIHPTRKENSRETAQDATQPPAAGQAQAPVSSYRQRQERVPDAAGGPGREALLYAQEPV